MFKVGYPRTRGIGYTRMFLHKRPNNSLKSDCCQRPSAKTLMSAFVTKRTFQVINTTDLDIITTHSWPLIPSTH